MAIHHGNSQSMSSIIAAAGGVCPLVVNENNYRKRYFRKLLMGWRDSYLIQELPDDSDPSSAQTQLLHQFHVLHLEPGEPVRGRNPPSTTCVFCCLTAGLQVVFGLITLEQRSLPFRQAKKKQLHCL